MMMVMMMMKKKKKALCEKRYDEKRIKYQLDEEQEVVGRKRGRGTDHDEGSKYETVKDCGKNAVLFNLFVSTFFQTTYSNCLLMANDCFERV
ncbi:hypothetical protein O3M35_010170 [Rhynocoris fuscipes]|uniref:Uncharacterized protein n=1 Tax=Rhynocoris fuscipes TaxID=488301 RepID=A0AAW1D5M8_9HEMI